MGAFLFSLDNKGDLWYNNHSLISEKEPFMKRIITVIFTILLLTVLVSCQGEPQSIPDVTTSLPETTEEEKTFELNASNFKSFLIIRPDVCEASTLTAAVTLKTALSDMGFDIRIKPDFVRKGDPVPQNEPEILIGKTNRDASKKYYNNLRRDDYVIAFEENKIIIVGGSEEATLEAVKAFIEGDLKKINGTLTFPCGAWKTIVGNYNADNLILCEKSISEYEIILPKNADAITNHAALLISERIESFSGWIISTVNEKNATGKRELRLIYDDVLNDDQYAFIKSEKGFEIRATKRTMLYAVRELTAMLIESNSTEQPDMTPSRLSETQKMSLPEYALPDSLSGKAPIALCDQLNKKAVIIDLNAADPTSDSAILWEWKPSSSNGFSGAGFSYGIDDVKLRYSTILKEYVVCITSSSGFMGVAEYPSGKKIWEVNSKGDSPHSIDYLPNGLVACALSTGGDAIRIYACDSKGNVLSSSISDALTGAHAVHWDNEFGVLWAMGTREIIAYEISGTPDSPKMTRIEGLGCDIGSGGHDFSAIPNENGLFWFSSSSVRIFDKYENKLISNYPGSGIISTKSVKSICGLPDGRIVRAVATNVHKAHDTDTLTVFTPQANGTYTKTDYVFEDRAFYKARPFMLH